MTQSHIFWMEWFLIQLVSVHSINLESLTIQNNILGPKSTEALCEIISINHNHNIVNKREARVRLKTLELNKWCTVNSLTK